MTKTASQRRFKKRTAALSELLTSDPQRFEQVWNTLCRGWIDEIHTRARSWRCGNLSGSSKTIHNVFDQALLLARTIGADQHALVEKSLIDLQHLCSSAVARITDQRLYRFDEDCTVRIRRRAQGTTR
jgi:hypothetical protein